MTPPRPEQPATAAGRDFLALAERDPSIMDIEGFRDRILAIEAEAASPSAGLRAALAAALDKVQPSSPDWFPIIDECVRFLLRQPDGEKCLRCQSDTCPGRYDLSACTAALAASGWQVTREGEGLRAALERLVDALSKDTGWDHGLAGGYIAGAFVQARAALASGEEGQ